MEEMAACGLPWTRLGVEREVTVLLTKKKMSNAMLLPFCWRCCTDCQLERCRFRGPGVKGTCETQAGAAWKASMLGPRARATGKGRSMSKKGHLPPDFLTLGRPSLPCRGQLGQRWGSGRSPCCGGALGLALPC